MTYSPHFADPTSDSIYRWVGVDPIRADCEPAWKAKVSAKEFSGFAAFAGDLVILGIESNRIAALRLDDGEEVWRIKDPTKRKRAPNPNDWPEFRAEGNSVLVMNQRYAIIDATDGSITEGHDEWLVRKMGFPNTVRSGDWKLCSKGWLNTKTEELRTRLPGTEYDYDNKRHRHYLNSSFDGVGVHARRHAESAIRNPLVTVDAMDLRTGRILWTKDLSTCLTKTIVARDVLIVSESKPRRRPEDPASPVDAVALDLRTGTELWRYSGGFDDFDETRKFWPSTEKRPTSADPAFNDVLLSTSSFTRGCHYLTRGLDRRSGRELWSTKTSLAAGLDANPLGEDTWAGFSTGAFPFARAGRVLFLQQITAKKKRVPKSGTESDKPELRKASELVSIDLVSGKLLHRQRVPYSSSLVGQHRGNLLVRSGSTLTCYR